jgi:hypothetical protein
MPGILATKGGQSMQQSPIHPAACDAEQLLAECQVRRLRRSGPGGQHRNKVETAVSLRHLPTGVEAEASERRSQAENGRMALGRLRVNLALGVRCPKCAICAPSTLWQSRVVDGQLRVSARHEHFPALLAEALDVLASVEADSKRAAAVLGCTPSQLLKFLKHEPRALTLVNGWRQERGLHGLR